VPQLLSSVSELQYKLGDYIDEANNWIDVHSENASDTLKYIFSLASGALNNILVVISNYLKNALPVVGSFLSGFIAIVGQSLLGLIFSILFLFSYEFFGSIAKKMVMSVFKRDRYARLMETTTNINKSFGGYIRGVILNALIVGIVTFALLAILRVEYAPLISIIMGVANMIPMFGPIIGAIPSALVLLVTQPDKLLWFIIIVLAIQAIDGYTVAPKLMGTSIGLSSEWVLISIIVMAGLFGLPGLFIGVPIFAVAYSIIGDFANKRLTKKEMSTDIKDYCSEEDYEIISESFRASLEKKTKKAKA
jgi:predicted PurR-regulated permease PerM